MSHQTGYIGKIPHRGDFVTARLPGTFTQVFDDWAEQLVQACKQEFGDDFASMWFNLPVYRFVFSTGLAGDHCWQGLLAPSQDAVGRQYPFCLARRTHSAVPALLTASGQDSYFGKLESLLPQWQTSDHEYSNLIVALDDIDNQAAEASPIDPAIAARQLHCQSDEHNLAVRIDTTNQDNTAPMDAFTLALLTVCCKSYSIWHTSPISNSSAEWLLTEGLPNSHAAPSLLNGDFSTSSWTQLKSPENSQEQRENNRFIPAEGTIDADWSATQTPAKDKTTETTDDTPVAKATVAPQRLELDLEDDTSPAPWED